MDPSTLLSASESVSTRLAELFVDADVVAIYIPIHNELDLRSLVHVYPEKTWLAPRVTSQNTMEFAEIDGSFQKGPFGIQEPTASAADPSTIQWVVVPGLAFDRSGQRLGFGAGYYDTWLETHQSDHGPHVVGVAMEWQLVERIPHEPHDVRMEYLVTETQRIDCGMEEHNG